MLKIEVCFISATAPSERLSLENFMNNIIIFMMGLQDLTWKCGKDLDGMKT